MSAKRAKAPGRKKPSGRGTCRVPDCGNPVSVKKHDLCVAHVSRLYRTGEVGPAAIRPRRDLKPFAGPA